jgi:Uma2 family endonuclease
MTPTISEPRQKLTFEQFLEQYPEDGRYELVDGEIVRILATRQHDDVADFIAKQLDREVDRLSTPRQKRGTEIRQRSPNQVS